MEMVISDFLASLDPNHVPIVVAGFALLCVVVLALGFVLQALSSIIELVAGLVEALIGLVAGGPSAWLGCVLAIAIIAACVGGAFLLLNAPESCAAHPTNFCRWLGFIP